MNEFQADQDFINLKRKFFKGESLEAIEKELAQWNKSDLSYQDEAGNNLLHVAVTTLLHSEYARDDVIEPLIKAGVPVTALNHEGLSPLMLAIKQTYRSSSLHAIGERLDSDYPPRESSTSARYLIKLGADLHQVSPISGQTPLMLAAERAHFDIVEQILQTDPATAKTQDAQGNTALHGLFKHSQYGVDHDMSGFLDDADSRQTLKHFIELVPESLLITNHEGQIPLHLLAILPIKSDNVLKRGVIVTDPWAVNAMKVMVKGGADINQHDATGKSVLDLLKEQGRQGDAQDLLETHQMVLDQDKPSLLQSLNPMRLIKAFEPKGKSF